MGGWSKLDVAGRGKAPARRARLQRDRNRRAWRGEGLERSLANRIAAEDDRRRVDLDGDWERGPALNARCREYRREGLGGALGRRGGGALVAQERIDVKLLGGQRRADSRRRAKSRLGRTLQSERPLVFGAEPRLHLLDLRAVEIGVERARNAPGSRARGAGEGCCA